MLNLIKLMNQDNLKKLEYQICLDNRISLKDMI